MSRLFPPPASAAPRPPLGADASVPHLVFTVDAQPYACPITRVERLMLLSDARILPRSNDAPAWEVGRLAARKESEEMPVVSLRALWGSQPLVQPAGLDFQALLIVNLAGHPTALLVDTCLNVAPKLALESAGFRLPSRIQGARGRAFRVAIPWKETLLIILELNNLLQTNVVGESEGVFDSSTRL